MWFPKKRIRIFGVAYAPEGEACLDPVRAIYKAGKTMFSRRNLTVRRMETQAARSDTMRLCSQFLGLSDSETSKAS